MITGKVDGDDISETDFVDKMMRRLEGHGSSLTASVKNDADWELFKSEPFFQKVNIDFRSIIAAKFVIAYQLFKQKNKIRLLNEC